MSLASSWYKSIAWVVWYHSNVNGASNYNCKFKKNVTICGLNIVLQSYNSNLLDHSSKEANAWEDYQAVKNVQNPVHLFKSVQRFSAVGRLYCCLGIDEYMKLIDEVITKYLFHDRNYTWNGHISKKA